jgi:hypothetical protein
MHDPVCASTQMALPVRATMIAHSQLIENNMKKLLCALALLLGASAGAQAQVYFEPGSAKPINPGAATHSVRSQQRAHAPLRVMPRLVRCRDGSRHTLRGCRSHRGVVHR